jgi:hypothetical protein
MRGGVRFIGEDFGAGRRGARCDVQPTRERFAGKLAEDGRVGRERIGLERVEPPDDRIEGFGRVELQRWDERRR